MTTTVSIRLGETELKEVSKVEKTWQIDRSEAIRRLLTSSLKEWKITNALEKLKKHEYSIGEAAEECNLDLWQMMDLAKEKDINWTGYGKEDLERDLTFLK